MSANGNGGKSRFLPYGEPQGSFRGVIACSNRDDGFFSGESNYVDHVVYTGYRYQCVEYARRFLLLTTGCIFDSCGRASEIFDMDTLIHVETGAKLKFIAHPNGKSTRRPSPGDIIVYPYHHKLLPWGHVGVISYVRGNVVGIAEQNHVFSHFISPEPNYLDGERCVSRFIDLEMKADGFWRLKERQEDILDCLGWMSYPTAPRREMIHQPLQVLPEQRSVRETPVESEDHPCLWRFKLPKHIHDIRSLYVFCNGTGVALTGATTAISRIIWVTLQFLFKRDHLSAGFVALPRNPLGANLLDVSKELDDVMMAALGSDGGDNNDVLMNRALSVYFSLPVDVIAAMRREFQLSETHMFAAITFYYNLALENTKQFKGGVEARLLKAENPHDEAWLVARTNFGTPVFMRELAAVRAARHQCVDFIHKVVSPEASCRMSYACSSDFEHYIKCVEEIRGSRNCLTIIKSSSYSDDDVDSVVKSIVVLCESFQYTTHVVNESQLVYKTNDSKLYVHFESGVKMHVDFCFCISEWAEILASATDLFADSFDVVLKGRLALLQAAIDPRSDVVFAKPLWSLLCSGDVHHIDSTVNKISVKFFDISRRLYEYSRPKQRPETWECDVHEYRDSCRRCHLAISPMLTSFSSIFCGEAITVNFSPSCCVGREADGGTAGLMHFYQ